eukprot:jgi/Chlat1/4008/Chrsp26S00297
MQAGASRVCRALFAASSSSSLCTRGGVVEALVAGFRSSAAARLGEEGAGAGARGGGEGGVGGVADVVDNSGVLGPPEGDLQGHVGLEGEPLLGSFPSEDFLDGDAIDSILEGRDGLVGLPPLDDILMEDREAEEKELRRLRERIQQEEIARRRVRVVDELGRAYATGKRKCSIARVWLSPGGGPLMVNSKGHDQYFQEVNGRADSLRPFLVTGTLGNFSMYSTVKGGGISSQAGAIRHGISKALQAFDPALRPPLKEAGFLTRDPRVVERKKPGKAKARKSFQWVKR